MQSSHCELSRTVGPSIGGFLSRPEENFPEITQRYPILRDVGRSRPALP